MLSDREIRQALYQGDLVVESDTAVSVTAGTAIQPASIDVRLDRYFKVLRGRLYDDAHEDLDVSTNADVRTMVIRRPTRYLDPAEDSAPLFEPVKVGPGELFVLGPGECALASTAETVRIGDDLVGRVEGKSSVGRLFLLVHTTAGFIDPGFHGKITLELVNLAPIPIRLHPGMKIGQLALQRLGTPAARPYGSAELQSRYQWQTYPATSRSYEGFRADLAEHAP